METVHIIAVGAFGMEVARRLEAKMQDVVITQADENGIYYPAGWPHARLHIVTSWRPVPSLGRLMDKLSGAWRKPWVPIIMDHPALTIGPVVVPGQEGCYACFSKRQIQHAPYGKYILESQDIYVRDFRLGPQGFLQAHAGMAVHLFLDIERRIRCNMKNEAGTVYEIHVIRGTTRKGKVTGFHGCPHCGLQREETTRSYDVLLDKYESIFTQG
ncbi:TOMM precursor leader peptide-binding protein [Paenibacillus oleatilyticus]|uniref:TOMM leader peptide-binding protein n=1 Tax=Paenibacillus oleatilyticus TaxID=2594886 RepID=A0ABV4V1H3_9BACL